MEFLRSIIAGPLPNILVVGGLIFLFLFVVGKFGANIVVDPNKQKFAGFIGVLLLIAGLGLHFIPIEPNGPPNGDKLTHEFLISVYWEFRHGEGDVISPRVRLHPNGTIIGVDHPNESTWRLEDGTLVFYHESGVPSTRFTSIQREDGKIILSGRLLLPGHEPVVIHVL